MLEVKDLVCAYSGIEAVRGVSLGVPAGRMVALIGPNGAGKSTLINAICGVIPSRGSIALDGRALAGRPAHSVAREGLLQVPEGRQILAPLSVRENLELGRLAAGSRARGDELERVHALFPLLAERASQLAGSLSGGQQQMLAIGRALMGVPRVLLLDEPSLGLAPIVVAQVFEALRALNESGLTILLVEQNARLALRYCHQAYVMELGRIVRHGESRALADDPKVIEHYLGHA